MAYEVTFIYSPSDDENDLNRHIEFRDVEVAGESYNLDAFPKILGKLGKGETKTLKDVAAVLIREPNNLQDRNAVGVHVMSTDGGARQVGHLSREDAEEYLGTIKKLEKRTQQNVGCNATVYGKGKASLLGKPVYRVTLSLPEDADEWAEWEVEKAD
jgi:hypothetical protein